LPHEKPELRDLAAFYAIAFGFSWAFWLPQALAAQGTIALPASLERMLDGPGNPAAWGPLVAALAMTALRDGRAGLRDLLRRTLAVRFGARWYVVILAAFPLLLGVPLAIAALAGEAIPGSPAAAQAGDAPLPVFLAIAFVVIFFIGGPLQEELGWRGFAQDRLQRRLGAVRAGLVVGLAWGLWHLPLFWLPRAEIYYNRPIWGLLLTTTLISVLFAWIYNRTGRSVFAMLLLHTAFNWTNFALPAFETDVGGLTAFLFLGLAAAAIAFRSRSAVAALVATCALWPAPASAKPPNIVLLLADDLGYTDLGSYGSEISTPHLDRLAAEGVRFTQYHTAASCAPTRAMLMTGVDSHRAGVPNIVEAIPPEQLESPYYQGSLRNDVATLAERLRESGYHTYLAGKWHLGHGPGQLPSERGFERTFALAATGADNWEDRVYMPIYDEIPWFADGEPVRPPEGFYSSRFYVDKAIEFIDEGGDDRPFFAYLAFQAVHIPVQAPREFTAKYLGRYDDGWSALREARLERAKRLSVVPDGTRLAPVPTTLDWNALDDEERRYRSKQMAVYAGMVEAMDFHIGRLIAHLESTGEYENTVFVFLSDNGAEGSDPLAPGLQGWVVERWLLSNGYSIEYETLGERGSFVAIGPSWASAAASPLAWYKFFAHEGGTRAPLIVSGPGVRHGGRLSDGFAWVTDVFATLVDLAGADASSGRLDGREVAVPSGRSLLPVLTGRRERVRGPDEVVGYELGGNAALFQGDYKLVLDRAPRGDGAWRLHDITRDPGEANDLSAGLPQRFAQMRREYQDWAQASFVLPVPEDYDQLRQVSLNALRARLGWVRFLALGIAGAAALVLGLWLVARRRAS
jgi:arylsulfatase/uncharacterized sulfatase